MTLSPSNLAREVPPSFLPDAALLVAEGKTQAVLHERAMEAARLHFGRRVFVRGVVEVSNYCRQNCVYCGMRRDNRTLDRYRTDGQKLAEMLVHHRPASMTDINIQAGEDPVAVRELVIPLIQTLRRETPLGVSVCLGSLSPALYRELQSAGATIYILKFETGDPRHYKEMESPGTLATRIENIRLLAETGWKVSSGFIVGLPGQGWEELAACFKLAAELPLSGCSVSPFVPGDETPTADAPVAEIRLALNSMAALRLMRPSWVIPAVSALNLAEPGLGYRRGLRTGANLVTMNLTPSDVRGDYLLYKRDRMIMTEERILEAISQEGLVPSEIGLAEHLAAAQPAGAAR